MAKHSDAQDLDGKAHTWVDAVGNLVDPASAAIARTLHHPVEAHLDWMVMRGATPERVRAVHSCLVAKTVDVMDCVAVTFATTQGGADAGSTLGGLTGLLGALLGGEGFGAMTSRNKIEVDGATITRDSKADDRA